MEQLSRKLDVLLEKQGGLETTVAVNSTNIGNLRVQLEKIDVAFSVFGDTLNSIERQAQFDFSKNSGLLGYGDDRVFTAILPGETDAEGWWVDNWEEAEGSTMGATTTADGSIQRMVSVSFFKYSQCIRNVAAYRAKFLESDSYSLADMPEEERLAVAELCRQQ